MSEEITQPMVAMRVTVDEEVLRKALTVCEAAIENAADCMVEHDRKVGRKTRKNKATGDLYERDIVDAMQCRDLLRAALGWPAITQGAIK